MALRRLVGTQDMVKYCRDNGYDVGRVAAAAGIPRIYVTGSGRSAGTFMRILGPQLCDSMAAFMSAVEADDFAATACNGPAYTGQ